MQVCEPHYPTSPVSSLIVRICLHAHLLVFYSFHEEIQTAWYTDMTQKELSQNFCVTWILALQLTAELHLFFFLLSGYKHHQLQAQKYRNPELRASQL